MTPGDRLKQIVAAQVIVVVVSVGLVFLVLRYVRTAALFGGRQVSHASVPIPYGQDPVNDGCPRGDHATRKDLTIHFFREMPWSRFDGWIEIHDQAEGRYALLYRGPYAPTITLRGVCYDDSRPGGDEVQLAITLVTKHHEYFFSEGQKLALGATSEVDILFGVDFADVPRAWMTPVR
jgi:hypothetical protein